MDGPIENITANPGEVLKPGIDPATLTRKWNIRTHEGWQVHARGQRAKGYLVKGLIPNQSLNLIAGESGLGKSALGYQLGLCVAAGIPFLGFPVQQGSVLYLDFENSVDQANTIVQQLCKFLGLPKAPDNFHMWNFNDCENGFGAKGSEVEDMMRDVGPTLVIVDPISGYCPEIEEKPTNVTKAYQRLRRAMSSSNASVIGFHHLVKAEIEGQSLENAINVRTWFKRVRGSSALINGCDVRVGVEQSTLTVKKGSPAGDEREAALLLRGFGRVTGEIPHLYVARVYDEDGASALTKNDPVVLG